MRAAPDDDPLQLPCGDIRLGDVTLLHTSTRRWIVDQRDASARAIEQIERSRAAARPMQRRGDQVELRGADLGVLSAVRVQLDGPQRVMVLFGDRVDDPDEIVALTVPDAHRLVQLVQAALASPAIPTREAG